MEENKNWLVCPMENENIREVVLPSGHIADLRKMSKNSYELTGLPYCVPKNNSLYSLGHLILGKGDTSSCSFNSEYRKFNNEFVTRVGRKYSDLVTVLYHNHPRFPIDSIPKELVEKIRQDSKDGIYDFLLDYGVYPSMEECVAEESRNLSLEDINATFGNTHILLSDTYRRGNNFSHINAYKLKNGFPDGLLKLVPLSSKSDSDHLYAKEVCNYMKQVYKNLSEEFKSDSL